jgi:peptidoglycan/LPS O-acetylase OafA/YrhL
MPENAVIFSGAMRPGQPAKPRELTERASSWLDLLRGLAAIAVFVGHWRALGLVNYGDLAHRSLVVGALYALSTLGHQAVMVFFVLSGYFVGGSVLRQVRAGTWSWRTYAVTRFTRLALVLWPSLLLCAALDYAGMHFFGRAGVYGGSPAYGTVIEGPVAGTLTPGIALGNALFVQGILVPTFGSNGALWSLSYELWYYVAFPLLVLAVAPGRAAAERATSAVLLAVVLAFVGGPIRVYFLIWLMGAGIAAVPPPTWLARVSRAGTVVLCLGLVGAGLYLARAPWPPTRSDLVMGVITATLVACIVADRRAGRPAGAFKAVASFTSRTSYSLYLAHLPMLVLLTAATHDGGRWQPTPRALGEWALVLAATYLGSLAARGLAALRRAGRAGHLDQGLLVTAAPSDRASSPTSRARPRPATSGRG